MWLGCLVCFCSQGRLLQRRDDKLALLNLWMSCYGDYVSFYVLLCALLEMSKETEIWDDMSVLVSCIAGPSFRKLVTSVCRES